MRKKLVAVFMCVAMVTGMAAGCGSSSDKKESKTADGKDMTELTLLVDTDVTTAGFEAVAAKAEDAIGVKVTIETRPGGADGDNIVKTRLASGDMADLCLYNSGALLNALNPEEYFIDLSGEEFVSRICREIRCR